MTPHELAFSLALQAIDDPDAREVRDDAIEEAGLTEAVERACYLPWDYSGPDAAEPWSRRKAKAVAAKLLVLDWSTEMWPAARRCGQWRTVTAINEIAGTITFETSVPKAANPYDGGRVWPKGWAYDTRVIR